MTPYGKELKLLKMFELLQLISISKTSIKQKSDYITQKNSRKVENSFILDLRKRKREKKGVNFMILE